MNERQRYKIARDNEKRAAAESMGFSVIYIWEEDIKNNSFTAIDSIIKGQS